MELKSVVRSFVFVEESVLFFGILATKRLLPPMALAGDELVVPRLGSVSYSCGAITQVESTRGRWVSSNREILESIFGLGLLW
jgi:hypothetical protein